MPDNAELTLDETRALFQSAMNFIAQEGWDRVPHTLAVALAFHRLGNENAERQARRHRPDGNAQAELHRGPFRLRQRVEHGGRQSPGRCVVLTHVVAAEQEVVTHAYLGLDVTEIPPATPGQGGTPTGLRVVAVAPGGPAATAGLLPDDTITSIDGQPAATASQLALVTLTHAPGQSVALGYSRAGTAATATLTLTPPPPPA